MMKQRILYLLMAFCFAFISSTATAGTAVPTVTLPSLLIDPPVIGDIITVPISISDITGLGYTGYKFNLTYNRSIVDYVGFSNVGIVSSVLGSIGDRSDTTNQKIVFAAFGALPMSGGGVLIYLI